MRTSTTSSAGADPGFCQGEQLLRPKLADVAKCSDTSEVSEQFAARIQGLLKDHESFWGLMLKYTFSNILETLFVRVQPASISLICMRTHKASTDRWY